MKFNLPNADALRKLANDAENRKKEFEGDDIRWEKFEKTGHYRFIVCPPYNEQGIFVKQIFTHWNLGEKGETKMVCPEYNPNPDEKRPCPICAVTKVVREQMDNDEDRKKLTNWYSRGSSYVNVRMLTIGDKDVENNSEYFLPRLLRGPSKMSDHINYHLFQLFEHRQKKGFDFDHYEWDDEIVFDIKKIQVGNNKNNVKYEYQVSPIRSELVANGKTLKDVVESMYDLDLVLAKQIKWSREDYDTSVALANSLLSFLGYGELNSDQWDEIAPFRELEKKVSSKQEERDEKPKKQLNIGGSQSRKTAKKEDESEGDSEEGEPAPSPTPQVLKKATQEVATDKVATNPAPVVSKVKGKAAEATGGTDDMVRDPNDMGADGNPKCFGFQDIHSDVCKECRFLHICLSEKFKRKLNNQKKKG